MQTMRDFTGWLRRRVSDSRTAIAALTGSSPSSSVAVPTSTASMDAPTGEAGWCRCMLHSDSTSGCGAAPAWLQDHTGRDGELFFKVQDSAWGNAMMQLRDSVSPPGRPLVHARPHAMVAHAEPVCVALPAQLAIALVLNRRPVLVVDGSWSTLYRGNLSLLLEVWHCT